MRSVISQIWRALFHADNHETLPWWLAPILGFLWSLGFIAVIQAPPAFTPLTWGLMWIGIYTGGGLFIGVYDLMRGKDQPDNRTGEAEEPEPPLDEDDAWPPAH